MNYYYYYFFFFLIFIICTYDIFINAFFNSTISKLIDCSLGYTIALSNIVLKMQSEGTDKIIKTIDEIYIKSKQLKLEII